MLSRESWGNPLGRSISEKQIDTRSIRAVKKKNPKKKKKKKKRRRTTSRRSSMTEHQWGLEKM